MDYFPLPKLHSIMGFNLLAESIFGTSGYAIVGTLRDTTGPYVPSFHFLGALALIGGLLFAGLPIVERLHKHKENAFL